MVENKDERLWAMLCHLAGLIGCCPFANIVAPLIIWQMKKDEFPFVDDQGKEAVNFNISITIYAIVVGLLTAWFAGPIVVWILGIAALILIIIAAVKANSGEAYRYPFIIRFIK
jgi:uncharacterized Tic20 family protein